MAFVLHCLESWPALPYACLLPLPSLGITHPLSVSVNNCCASQISKRDSVLMAKIYSYRKERLPFKTCLWSVDLKQDPVQPGWIPKPQEIGGGKINILTWVLRVTESLYFVQVSICIALHTGSSSLRENTDQKAQLEAEHEWNLPMNLTWQLLEEFSDKASR